MDCRQTIGDQPAGMVVCDKLRNGVIEGIHGKSETRHIARFAFKANSVDRE